MLYQLSYFPVVENGTQYITTLGFAQGGIFVF